MAKESTTEQMGDDLFHHSPLAPMPAVSLKIGNPGPVGLTAFGITTILLNFLNAGISEGAGAGMIMSYGIFHGGFIQFVAGCFEQLKGNTFAGTAFMSYVFARLIGGFWMGIGCFEILGMSGNVNTDFKTGKAVLFCCWGLFTAGMFIGTLRMNRGLQFVFASLALLFFFLAGGVYSSAVQTIAGYIGIICGLSAMYTAWAEVMNEVYGRDWVPLGKVKQY